MHSEYIRIIELESRNKNEVSEIMKNPLVRSQAFIESVEPNLWYDDNVINFHIDKNKCRKNSYYIIVNTITLYSHT